MSVNVWPPKGRAACLGSGDLPGSASQGQVTDGQCGRSKGPFFSNLWYLWALIQPKEATRGITRRILRFFLLWDKSPLHEKKEMNNEIRLGPAKSHGAPKTSSWSVLKRKFLVSTLGHFWWSDTHISVAVGFSCTRRSPKEGPGLGNIGVGAEWVDGRGDSQVSTANSEGKGPVTEGHEPDWQGWTLPRSPGVFCPVCDMTQPNTIEPLLKNRFYRYMMDRLMLVYIEIDKIGNI